MSVASVQTNLGQITPPEDNWKTDWSQDNTFQFPADPVDAHSIAADAMQRARTSRSSSGDISASGVQGDVRVDKKDKYREKNRVAAAKCRAKKKEHVDGLEENHRTQSMLNSLLKQTEQNLRDELSFWRTQALQHAYCDCHAIQDYNLKKARALAADKEFGGDALRRDSIAMSPSSKNGAMSFYPPPNEFDAQHA